MNVEKYLKKRAKEDLAALETPSDRAFLEELKSKVQPDGAAAKKRSRVRFYSIATAAALACAILIVCLSVLLPVGGPPVYLAEDCEQAASSLEELNAKLNTYSVNFDSGKYDVALNKIYDKPSGDSLYYLAKVTGKGNLVVSFSMAFVVNEHYNYDFTLEDYESSTHGNFEIKYFLENTTDDAFGITTFSGQAEIHSKKDYIYIFNYSEFSLTGESVFLDIISDIIRLP